MQNYERLTKVIQGEETLFGFSIVTLLLFYQNNSHI